MAVGVAAVKHSWRAYSTSIVTALGAIADLEQEPIDDWRDHASLWSEPYVFLAFSVVP